MGRAGPRPGPRPPAVGPCLRPSSPASRGQRHWGRLLCPPPHLVSQGFCPPWGRWSCDRRWWWVGQAFALSRWMASGPAPPRDACGGRGLILTLQQGGGPGLQPPSPRPLASPPLLSEQAAAPDGCAGCPSCSCGRLQYSLGDFLFPRWGVGVETQLATYTRHAEGSGLRETPDK